MTAQERAQDIKALLTAGVAFLTALWGWLGWAIFILVLAMVTDYITGSIAANAAGEWSSSVARAGLRHKLGVVIAVGVAAFADMGVRVALKNAEGLPFMNELAWPDCFTLIVTLWYLFTELGSIVENIGKLGAPVPEFMVKCIAVLKAKTEETYQNKTDEEVVEQITGETMQAGKHEVKDSE